MTCIASDPLFLFVQPLKSANAVDLPCDVIALSAHSFGDARILTIHQFCHFPCDTHIFIASCLADALGDQAARYAFISRISSPAKF